MDVTTQNFGKIKQTIINQIKKASYFSFDLQFTGLRYDKFQRDRINLLPFEKYQKLKYVAEAYQVLQLGLSIVLFDDHWKIYPYNFYLFPRNPIAYDQNVNMQLGCVKFNAQHGMDWNKWIRHGINYIKLSQKQQLQNSQKPASISEILAKLSGQCQQIARDFLQTLSKVDSGQLPSPQIFEYERIYHMQKTLLCLFDQSIHESQIQVSLEQKEDAFILRKISRDEIKQNLEKQKQNIYGFSLIFQHIWQSQKNIVGHNCLLDLMYVFNCFVQPLPEDYFQFKKLLMKSGNTLFDTKYIALNNPKFSNGATRLQDLVKLIQKEHIKTVDLSIDQEYSKYTLDNPNLHEAGYDSYITAWVYQQFYQMDNNIDKTCANKLNMNQSFFFINLAKQIDQTNLYFSRNILRINIEVKNNDDLRQRRWEEVKKIKMGLAQLEYNRDYQIHQGYRELFLQIKNKKKQILKAVFALKIKDIKTFPVYLQWQAQRIKRSKLAQQNRYNYRNKPKDNEKKEKRQDKQEQPKNESEPSQRKSQKQTKTNNQNSP